MVGGVSTRCIAGFRGFIIVTTAVTVLLASTLSEAQESSYRLFDRFSIAVEGSWATLDTVVRLDSGLLGKGTELSFENDGGDIVVLREHIASCPSVVCLGEANH